MLKRKRSIQRQMDRQVLEEAETEAKLEESIMDEEIVQKESKVFEIRRQRIRLETAIAAAKKKTLLQKISTKVKSALDRFKYATESLDMTSAKKIQAIEDQYAREQAQRERELQHINTEEQNKADSHRLRRRDRQVFHGRDATEAEEDLVASVQASETEDLLTDDEDAEEEEDVENVEDEVDEQLD